MAWGKPAILDLVPEVRFPLPPAVAVQFLGSMFKFLDFLAFFGFQGVVQEFL